MNFINWLDSLLNDIPADAIAFNFNLYETESDNLFEAQLVGSNQYDLDDEDWACNTIYSSEENLFSFEAEDWEDALEKIIIQAKEYIINSDNNKIKNAKHVTAGFVDGNLEIIFTMQ